jgi:hydroxypyruvate isomerase
MEPYTKTAGVGGRNGRGPRGNAPAWRAVATAIGDLPLDEYLAHGFIPTGDPLTSLREAVILCDV